MSFGVFYVIVIFVLGRGEHFEKYEKDAHCNVTMVLSLGIIPS
jgi:hypothetical protein